MLDQMRKKSKHITLFIAIMFVGGMAIMGLSGVFDGNKRKSYIGKVNGQKIKPDVFQTEMRNQMQNWSNRNKGKEVDDRTVSMIKNQAWNTIVQRTLIEQAIKDRNIKVTDDEISEKILNPSDEIKKLPMFQTEGKFDKNKYFQALQSEQPMPMGNGQMATFGQILEQDYRSRLPYEKLYDNVYAEVSINDEDVKADYEEKNNKADIKFVYFKAFDYKDVKVPEEDLKKYYDEHQDEYKKGPARKVKYIKMLVNPSKEDDKINRSKIDEIYERAIKGEDFAELAKQTSEGPSAPKGGDLGWFGKNRMDKNFERVAFATKVGEISKPVRSAFGWHVIKVEDKRKDAKKGDEVKASHILIKNNPSETTIAEVKAKLEGAKAKLDAGSKLEDIAKEMKLNVTETRKFFEKASYIGGIGQQKELVEFAFANPKGSVFEPFAVDGRTEKTYYLAQVSYEVGDHIDEFANVKPRIEGKLKKEIQLEKAMEDAKAYTAKYTGKKLFTQAEKDKKTIVDQQGLTAKAAIKSFGVNEDLSKAIFATKEGEFTELFKGQNGVVKVLVEKRIKPDWEKFEKEKETITETFKKQKETKHFNEWFSEMQKSAKIEDFRSEFGY